MITAEGILGAKPKFKGSYVNGVWKTHLRPSGSWESVSPANIDWALPPVSFCFDDVNECVEAGKKAFKTWSKLPLDTRIKFIKSFGQELRKRSEMLAKILSFETGKPLSESLSETDLLQTKINGTLDYALKLISNQDLDLGSQGRAQISYRAKGLFVVMGPFNLALSLPHGHIIPALVTGNVCIFKPSEKTPYSAHLYMEAAEAAGLPAGVLQLIQGQAETGIRLVRDTEIDGVFATCTFDVGARIQKECSEKPQRTTVLQMGAKNAAIVWKGADIEATAEALIKSAFMTTGQRCTALPRVYVEKKLMPEIVNRVHEMAKELVVSHPFDTDPAPFMGPLISSVAKERFFRYIGIAESENAESIMRSKSLEGMTRLSRKPIPVGHYVTPSIHLVDKWNAKSPYQTHEIFGPDICFCPIESLEEGIACVNGTGYGLAFSLFGADEKTFHHTADQIETGLVYWNRGTVGSLSRLPFGGWKKSGNNRPGALFSVYATTQVQTRVFK